MCGRYEWAWKKQSYELSCLIGLAEKRQGLTAPSGEIFPSDTAPILRMQGGEIQADFMTWGFLSPKGSGLIINARSETADERPMFCRRLSAGRCAVPSTGFYEWSHSGTKIKYRFRRPGTELLYMAGLYDLTETGGRFVILTTAAGVAMFDIHDRQPVVLRADELARWLTDETYALSLLRRDAAHEPALTREQMDGPKSEDYEQLRLPFL